MSPGGRTGGVALAGARGPRRLRVGGDALVDAICVCALFSIATR
ncbi:MAG: hypothetical protein ABR511_02055 [Acidimicrobiales bacterium]